MNLDVNFKVKVSKLVPGPTYLTVGKQGLTLMDMLGVEEALLMDLPHLNTPVVVLPLDMGAGSLHMEEVVEQ